MINDIKEYFRFKLYEECRILVNDLKDVIDETKMFLDNKIYPYLKENNGRIDIYNIKLTYENEKIVWRIIESNEINDVETLNIDYFNIKDFIDDEYIKEIKELKENYPKELCGYSLLAFMQTMNYFVYSSNLINDIINVFDICMLSDNGNNNVIYEVQ